MARPRELLFIDYTHYCIIWTLLESEGHTVGPSQPFLRHKKLHYWASWGPPMGSPELVLQRLKYYCRKYNCGHMMLFVIFI